MDLNLISWVTLALVFLLAGWLGIRLLRERLEEQRYRDEMADLEFQEKVLSTMGTPMGGDDTRFLQGAAEPKVYTSAGQPAADLIATPSMVIEAQGPANTFASPTSPLPADVAAAGVMQQLGATGLVKVVDGYLPLHNNPKGVAILRLRNGKTALLVPQMESESFLRANARRADMIIMAGADGKAVVLTSLEQFLAETISPA